MTYECSHILRQLRKLSKYSDSTMGYIGESTEICLLEDTSITYNYSKWEKEIESILNELIRQGYLELDFNKYHFHLTHKGLHPYKIRFESFKLFLLKSVAVPIVVSATTSLIVLWLQGL